MGLSQAALGKRINISQKEVSHYENNYRKPPVEVLPTLAKTLGTTIENLYGESAVREYGYTLQKQSIWLVAEKMEYLNEDERREVLDFVEKRIDQKRRNQEDE